jgi:lysophospholipase L1-like esterase
VLQNQREMKNFVKAIVYIIVLLFYSCSSPAHKQTRLSKLCLIADSAGVKMVDDSLFGKNIFLEVPSIDAENSALDAFFVALHRNSKVVRIAHWGDSQIEGGRLSKELRTYFQNIFGGQGVGYVPIVDITSPISYSYSSSENWMRYTFFHHRLQNSLYGPGGSAFKPVPFAVIEDSTQVSDSIMIGASSFTNAFVNFTLPFNYARAVLWYGPVDKPTKVRIFMDGKQDQVYLTLDGTNSWNEVEIHGQAHHLKLVFPLESPLIYGLSFESSRGVIIDNFGLRGHSGDGILLVKDEVLKKYVENKNVELLIFQFGANVIPYLHDEKSVNEAIHIYDKILQRMRILFPKRSMLFIGPGDMPLRGRFASNPFIKTFNEKLKNIALKNGCAYFDVYGFMGGEGSLGKWVKNKLTSEDGHFTNEGRELLAREIMNELLHSYHLFLLRMNDL